MTVEEAKAFLKSKESKVSLTTAHERGLALKAIKTLSSSALTPPQQEEEEENE